MDISQRLANLSPEQRALLKQRLKQKGWDQQESADKIPQRDWDQALPLSFAQQRLWFLDRLEPDSPAYNLAAKVNLEGPLNVTALEATLNAIIQRHEVWRTNFTANEQGQPRQIIAETRTIALPIVDLAHLTPWQQQTEVSRLAIEQAKTPFDLENDQLVRAKLLRLSAQHHIMVFTMHHIVSDGWSLGVLLREVASLYEAFCEGRQSPLPELPIQYADFAIWQRQQLQSGQLDRQLDYWKDQLANPPLLQLPTDYARPPVQTFRGVREQFTIPQSLVDELSRLSQQEGVTLFMTLLAALKVLLYRYTGQSDLMVGSPVAGRDRAELEGLIGFFVNMLVLRTDASGDPSFRDFLKRVQKVTLDAYSHQAVPFEKLVEELQPERDLNRNPLYQVSLTLNNFPMPSSELSELNLDLEEIDNQTTQLDLSLHLYPVAEGLSGWFEYSTDLFHPDTINRMVGHWKTLLQGIVAHPDQPLSQLPLLTSSEEQAILREWNQTQTHDWPQQCFHELVEAQVERSPDAIAVVCQNQQLSYRELHQRANQLAHYLQDLGVGPEELVGLHMERSLEMVITLLGILQAGGAYLPLDPNEPQQRIFLILRDADPCLVLTQQHLRSQLPEGNYQLLAMEQNWEMISQQPSNPLKVPLALDNLVYTIYTSGSTGQPKGVQIPHGALSNFLSAMEQKLQVSRKDTCIALTPLCFDIAALELFLPLTVGGQTVVMGRELARDGSQLSRELARTQASVIQATPASWQLLLQGGWQGHGSLKLLCGGEALSPNLAEKLLARASQLWNVYGPTETTIWSTAQQIHHPDGLSIGTPLLNTEAYVLDAEFQPVPIGVPGELYLGGTGLSRGYRNRWELTAEKFVPHPYTDKPGRRLYRTGDLVRYQREGSLQYLGRMDNQVKLRGFRIELEELEHSLTEHPAVAQAVISKQLDDSNHEQLVGYVVPEQASLEHQTDHLAQWESLWDQTYQESMSDPNQDPVFNTAGWNSSYTDQPIPDVEMQEWVEQTVTRILNTHPQNILEIGCGTGLLLFRLVPYCQYYWGTDISQTALDYIKKHLPQQQFPHVRLEQQSAEVLDGIDRKVDTVILNSVVQYFPSIEYLVQVLEKVVRVTQAGGTIFIGDVRSLPLLEAFHTAVQLYQAPGDLSCQQLRQRVQQHIAQEQELVIDPGFFQALKQFLPEIEQVRIQPKRGRYCNEMTQFRYDVTLHVTQSGQKPASTAVSWFDWQQQSLTLNQIQQWLAQTELEHLGIKNIPNARVQADLQRANLLHQETAPATVEQLRNRFPEPDGIDPETFWSFQDQFSYTVEIDWSKDQDTYDVVFQKTPVTAFAEEIVDSQPWSAYANNPLQGRFAHKLLPQLREYLHNRLPDYMVPSVFTLLNEVPLTPNGKVDRSALPKPTFPAREETVTSPRTPVERILAEIWKQILGLEQVGIHDNFFELGGDSLLSMQVVAQGKQHHLQLTPKQLFECQTIAELAAITEKGQVEESNEATITASFPLLDQATLDTLEATYPTLEDVYPLSPIQQGILFHALYTSDTEVYFEQWQCTLQGNLDRMAFQQAWQRVINRHPILRTSFHWEKLDDPVQIVHQQVELPWWEQNWQNLSASEQSKQLTALEQRDRDVGFQLSQAPLMRLSLIQMAEQTYQFIWSHHHLLIDGWSSAAILKEVFDCYQAFRQGGEPSLTTPPPYRNYIHWLQQQDFAEARTFWQQQLRGFTAPTSLNRLTTGKSRQGETVGSAKQEVSLSQQQFRDLQSLAQNSKLTLNAIFQGAWALLLSRYSGEGDVVFGTTVSGRPPDLKGSEAMIGVFINTLPVRAFVSSQNTLLPWLKQLQEQQVTLNQYQCSPLADIYRWSDVPSETSLFETILVFQNYPIDASLLEQTNNDLTFHNVRSVTRNNYPLTLRVTPLNGILLQAIYDHHRFDASAIARVLRELPTLLQLIIESSGNSRLGDLLEQLAEREKQQQAQQQQALKQSRRQKLGKIGRRSIQNR